MCQRLMDNMNKVLNFMSRVVHATTVSIRHRAAPVYRRGLDVTTLLHDRTFHILDKGSFQRMINPDFNRSIRCLTQ